MDEIWKAIPGYEGHYEVSSLGRVRSLSRYVPRACWANGHNGQVLNDWRSGRVLVPQRVGKGYHQVILYRGGNAQGMYVHRAVALVFLGPCPEGMETAHRNGIRTDNRLDNLRYDTPAGNNSDKVGHGTLRHGERAPNAKLTLEQVREIRSLKGIKSNSVLGREYGVGHSTINRIQNGVRWTHSL